jgi:sugar diacid utilization regulator
VVDIPDVPEEHLEYLEETIYPTLLTAMEKLLQRVEERPNDELNAVNWLATYLHSNNPNNNLMRKADDLAADLRTRRSRVKIEAQEQAEIKKREDWRLFAVNMASMRSQERVRKKVPTLLVKASGPVVERECFYKHVSRTKSRRTTTANIFEAAALSAQEGGNPDDYMPAEKEVLPAFPSAPILTRPYFPGRLRRRLR